MYDLRWTGILFISASKESLVQRSEEINQLWKSGHATAADLNPTQKQVLLVKIWFAVDHHEQQALVLLFHNITRVLFWNQYLICVVSAWDWDLRIHEHVSCDCLTSDDAIASNHFGHMTSADSFLKQEQRVTVALMLNSLCKDWKH